jgi:hypothetical protein
MSSFPIDREAHGGVSNDRDVDSVRVVKRKVFILMRRDAPARIEPDDIGAHAVPLPKALS